MESTIIVAVLSLIERSAVRLSQVLFQITKLSTELSSLSGKWRSITVLLSVWRLLKIHLNLSSTKLMN